MSSILKTTATDIMSEDAAIQRATDKFWLENVSKIKVETELAPLPQLSLDPEQIAQALGNLFKNAIEAMPDGGMLKVKTYFTPNGGQGNNGQQKGFVVEGNTQLPHAESGKWKATEGTVSLEIQDTGRGMSEETMANLFVPYYTTKG